MSFNIEVEGGKSVRLATAGKYCDRDIVVTAIDGNTIVFPHSTIPEYIKNEAASVVERVKAVQTDKTVTFLAMSDAHHDANVANIVNGNTHAGMAAKIIAYGLNLDFACMLGDSSWGDSETAIADGKTEIETVNRYISEAFEGLPQFRTVGNHDTMLYSYSQNGEILTDEYLFSQFGKYNEGAVYGSTAKGYCYRDFANKKIRVICLNTSEMYAGYNASSGLVSTAQQAWFANTLKDVGSKANANEWGVVILAHHPLDWGAVCYASNILSAYVKGESITINGSAVNFSGNNKTRFVAQIHGHTHGFKVDKLYAVNTSNWTATEQYNAKRVAIPNMCFDRTNEYGQNTGSDSNGIEFGTTEVFNKTAGTAKDTAFCVCVLNPETKYLHAICYGAGKDREIFLGEDVVAVTGITLNATSGTLKKTQTVQLNATVLPANATNQTVIWESSNTSVATVINGLVTAVKAGSATITARTADGGFEATYALTVQVTNLIDTYGYKDGYRLSTTSGNESQLDTATVTGFIPKPSKNAFVVRFKGVEMTADGMLTGYSFGLYNSSKEKVTAGYMDNGYSGSQLEIRKEGDVHIFEALNIGSDVAYMRFSGIGKGANLICTIDEEIN
jgi:hypothetical protein